MPSNDLDDDERELIRKHRAEKAEAEANERDVRVGVGDEYYQGPPSGAKRWLAARGRKYEPDEPAEGDSAAVEDKNVKRFQSGRRVS